MQDCTISLQDNFLEWENEQYRRLRQATKLVIEKSRNDPALDDARSRESLFIQKISQEFAQSQERLRSSQRWLENPDWQQNAPDDQAASAYAAGYGKPSVARSLSENGETVRCIPDMRPALIPLDESSEGEGWSNSFSLLKADMEPWTAFFKGYRTSRLFLGNAPTQIQLDKWESLLDFGVRALLELRRISPRVILEPAVQINGQVEYLDLAAEVRSCRDPALADDLIRIANEVHQSELGKAVVKGREMGDRLYQALLGTNHAHLVSAWEKVHRRKPSPEEMHMMLTAGRIVVLTEKQQETDMQARLNQERAAASRKAELDRQLEALEVPPEPNHAGATRKQAAHETPIAEQPGHRGQLRKILMYLLHAVVCCAAFVAYRMAG